MSERGPTTTVAPPLEHTPDSEGFTISEADNQAFADIIGAEYFNVGEQPAEAPSPSTNVNNAITRVSALSSLAPESAPTQNAETNVIDGEVVGVAYDEQDPAAKAETAKAVVAETGHATLTAAKGAAETSPSVQSLKEASSEVAAADSSARPGIARRVVNGIKTIAKKAYENFDVRMLDAYGYTSMYIMAEQAKQKTPQETTPEQTPTMQEAEQAEIEAELEIRRKQLMQERADKAHEEASDMNEQFDLENEAYTRNEAINEQSDSAEALPTKYEQYLQEARREAIFRAHAAERAKIRRQQTRQEIYNSLNEARREHLDQLRTRIKKSWIGRVLRFFRRHGRKLGAAFRAYRSTK